MAGVGWRKVSGGDHMTINAKRCASDPSGMVEQLIDEIILDTGCTRTLVRQDRLPPRLLDISGIYSPKLLCTSGHSYIPSNHHPCECGGNRNGGIYSRLYHEHYLSLSS